MARSPRRHEHAARRVRHDVAHHLAHQQVGDLRRRAVDQAGQNTAVGQLLHRLSASAGGVEDEAVIVGLQRRGDGLDAWRRDAEHGQPKGRALVGCGGRDRPQHHASQGVGRIAQHPKLRLPVGEGGLEARSLRRRAVGDLAPEIEHHHAAVKGTASMNAI